MSRKELASLMVGRAERWLLSSRDALRGKRYDDAVYCAQMCAEHAAKAALAVLGVEYPKTHDPGPAMREVEGRMPRWFRQNLDEIVRILAELAEKRGLAGYGFEKGLDVSFFRDAAPKAVRQAELVLSSCKRLVDELMRD
ncbi:MAG: HEPN domain-containing protein [Candidatus Hadarchaeales archaeon]